MNKLFRVAKTMSLNGCHNRGIRICGFPNFGDKVEINVKEHGNIVINKNFSVSNYTHIASIGGYINIGENVFINRDCVIVCRESIIIEDNCIFGPNVCIYDHDHRYDYTGIKNGYKKSQINIGKGCWIGANVTILRGACIGEKCIIGAGTVVKGSIPAHSIVTSNREMAIMPIPLRE